MIQPIHEYADMIYGCHVHDMVLDLICSLSTEENFITTLNGMEHISSSNIIRRLSLQNGKEYDDDEHLQEFGISAWHTSFFGKWRKNSLQQFGN